MIQLPPVSRDQRKVDDDHLNLLSIFHFVGGGLAFIGILFLLVHFAIIHTIFTNPNLWKGQNQMPPPAFLMPIFGFVYLFMAVWFVTSGVLNVMSGFFLRARKCRTFSIVVAAIDCLHIPLGTVLGVFTLVVLMRDTVRELYQANSRL